MGFIPRTIDHPQLMGSSVAFILTLLQCFDIILILRSLHWADPGMMNCIFINFNSLQLKYNNNPAEVRKGFKNEI